MIGIIDAGLGNIMSVCNAFDYFGVKHGLINNSKAINDCHALVLPGVGHFEHGMKALAEMDMVNGLNNFVITKKMPILGICLGMQLMCRYSQEGECSGLNWFDTNVMRIVSRRIKTPNMGWNDVRIKFGKLYNEMNDTSFYFVHSYYIDGNYKYVSSTIDSDIKIAASLEKENIYAVQFHPEKSQQNGLKVIKNFIDKVNDG